MTKGPLVVLEKFCLRQEAIECSMWHFSFCNHKRTIVKLYRTNHRRQVIYIPKVSW
jgi:hypothetical protein